MTKTKLRDAIDPKIKFSIEESSDVDGVNILAKVKGVFFVPNGVSRNNRFYSKSLWEKAISEEEVQTKLKNRNMFGTIGHNIEINDETLAQGKFSHIVTNAYIDEKGQGIGEALILNTDSGRILNTVLRAGSVIYVSSRGEGTFEGNKNGVPAVDESSYNLIGWDFVLNPGFLKANPSIAEALEKTYENQEGDKPMEKVLERLNNELVDVKSKYETTLTEKKSLTESVSALSEENNHVKAELQKSESALTETEKELNTVKEELAQFKTLGESFDSVKKALTESDSYISKVHTELGSFDRIKKALETACNFKESVDKLGTLSEIEEGLKLADKMVTEAEGRENEDRIASLAKELGVGGEAVAVLAAKGLQDDEIKSLLKKVGESFAPAKTEKKEEKKTEAKKVEKKTESLVKKDKKAEVIDEKKEDEAPSAKKSRLDRVMESFS